jgi:hypothetical protein
MSRISEHEPTKKSKGALQQTTKLPELHAGKDFIYACIVKLVDDYILNKRKIPTKSSTKKKLARFLTIIHKNLVSQHTDWKQGITDDVNNEFAKSKGFSPKERKKEELKHFFFRFPNEARAWFGTTKYNVVGSTMNNERW